MGNIYLVDDDGNELYVYYLSKVYGAGQGNNWDWTDVASGNLPNELHEGDVVVIYARALYTFETTGAQQVSSGFCISINSEPTN